MSRGCRCGLFHQDMLWLAFQLKTFIERIMHILLTSVRSASILFCCMFVSLLDLNEIGDPRPKNVLLIRSKELVRCGVDATREGRKRRKTKDNKKMACR